MYYTIIGGNCYKYHFFPRQTFCRVKTCLFSWQKYACRDFLLQQIFVTTNITLLQQSFVATSLLLSWHMFVATKHIFCHDKSMLVVTLKFRFLFFLWQKFCHSKHTFVLTKDVFCCDKNDTCGSSRQYCTPWSPSSWQHSTVTPNIYIVAKLCMWQICMQIQGLAWT